MGDLDQIQVWNIYLFCNRLLDIIYFFTDPNVDKINILGMILK